MKLIASDLDGTLLGADAALSRATIAALRAARAAGVHVVAATGRSHRSALGKLAPAGAIEWAVCSNGATVFDVSSERVHRHHVIPDDRTAAVIDAVRAALPRAGIAWETASGMGFDESFERLRPGLEEMGSHWNRPAATADVRPRSALKILIVHEELQSNALRAALADRVPADVSLSNSGAAFVEVTAAGVDKAFALAGLCAELGVDRADVVAFGDQHNDIAMLRWAGIGIAVENAHPEAAAAADRRTGRHDHDGVAQAVLDLLGETGLAS